MLFDIKKQDNDKRLVFGWASISKDEYGNTLKDWQGDEISPDELEKAAYDFVLGFRNTGEEHDPQKREKGKLVASMVFTQDIQKALGVAPGTLPIGWFVGFHIDDDAAWEQVKKGEYAMFSIEGKGQREPIKKSVKAKTWAQITRSGGAVTYAQMLIYFSKAMTYGDIIKYNPYHDRYGMFAQDTE